MRIHCSKGQKHILAPLDDKLVLDWQHDGAKAAPQQLRLATAGSVLVGSAHLRMRLLHVHALVLTELLAHAVVKRLELLGAPAVVDASGVPDLCRRGLVLIFTYTAKPL